jgi:hypothetical protein
MPHGVFPLEFEDCEFLAPSCEAHLVLTNPDACGVVQIERRLEQANRRKE